eukprot:1790981-Heterocapsa_arctica.AAC.1
MVMTSQHKNLASKAESPLHSKISISGLTMACGGPTLSFAMTVSPCGTKRDAPGGGCWRSCPFRSTGRMVCPVGSVASGEFNQANRWLDPPPGT